MTVARRTSFRGRVAFAGALVLAFLGIASAAAAAPSFTTRESVIDPGTHRPLSVAVGDFVNAGGSNGFTDVVATNLSSSERSASLMTGDGTGAFSTVGNPWPIDLGGTTTPQRGPIAAVGGDFDEDGVDDVAAANFASTVNGVQIMLMAGDGTLKSGPTTYPVAASGDPQPFFVQTGDLNGDGHLDLVTANQGPGTVSVLLGDGDGEFSLHGSPVTVGAQPRGIAIGDVNNDGDPDVLSSDENSNQVSVLIGDGTGGLTRTGTFSTGTAPRNVTLGDFNEDGDLDFATADSNEPNFPVGHTVTVRLGDGTGSFGSANTFETGTGTQPFAIVNTDLDGDGHLDLAVANRSSDGTTGGLTVLTGDGTGSFGAPQLVMPPDGEGLGYISVVVADVNDDGRPDLVSQEAQASSVWVALNTTTEPAAPTGLSVSPDSPSRDNNPTITGTAGAGLTVHVYPTADCSGPEAGSASGAAFGATGIPVTVANNSTTTFSAKATTSGWHSDCSTSTVTYTQDNTGTSTYYVRQSGTGSACTQANPCGSIGAALFEHRLSPTTHDVIDVGAGTFNGAVNASSSNDDGLTIRGTLDSGGSRMTTISSGADVTNCPSPAATQCAVSLGASPNVAVALEDVNVDTEGGDDGLTPVEADGGSDLSNVHLAAHIDAFPNQILAIGDDSGTVIDHSTIDAANDFSSGIATDSGGFDVTDSHIIGGCGCEAIEQDGLNGDKITVTRSWLESEPDGHGVGVFSTGDLTVDSSLITGGDIGIETSPAFASSTTNLQVQNSTIDVAQPGAYDSGYDDLLITGDGSSAIDATVGSSILADDVVTSTAGGPGSLTCTYTDLQFTSIDPPFDNNCPIGSGTNTSTDPAQQFVGGAPFSWELKASAPAIDAGEPGAVDPAFSQTDLAGNPRRAPGTQATCPGGIRDMGAYERQFACAPTNNQPPTVRNGSSPTAGVKLGSTNGTWSDDPTAYRNQWLRCDSGGSNCSAIMAYRSDTGTYRPGDADVGHTLRVRVIATNGAGDSAPATSAASGIVTQASVAPAIVQAPTVRDGSAPVAGVKLGSTNGTWSGDPTSYRNQWLRCDSGGANCSAIMPYRSDTGTYRPTNADVGHTLRVRVIATNGAGDSAPATSAASGVVS